jgi:hypothetical protein
MSSDRSIHLLRHPLRSGASLTLFARKARRGGRVAEGIWLAAPAWSHSRENVSCGNCETVREHRATHRSPQLQFPKEQVVAKRRPPPPRKAARTSPTPSAPPRLPREQC